MAGAVATGDDSSQPQTILGTVARSTPKNISSFTNGKISRASEKNATSASKPIQAP